jgi:calpain-7
VSQPLKNQSTNLPVNDDLDKLRLDSNNSPIDENENENNKFLNKLNIPQNPSGSSISTSNERFGKEEIAVLRRGSFINNREYVPFFPEIDSKEKFFFPIPFTHKEGKLALAASQRERFTAWVRPDEIFEKPTLMMLISSFSVKQTCISDCSFVASLTVCAQYERKFNKRILSK